jgi:hypothetical protein
MGDNDYKNQSIVLLQPLLLLYVMRSIVYMLIVLMLILLVQNHHDELNVMVMNKYLVFVYVLVVKNYLRMEM